ncbi:DinB family protein [Oceanobacillus rekensis]|uniref:DinB family protein n=1 Tax=Oceanobacillus rekensis TaxID=937927 RepID=UPI000B44C7B0|nr:DinB family protein [Oceanobacillus rekensis]
MAEPKVQGYIQSINTSFDNILKVTEDLSEKVIRWNPTEEEWSILQILSHLTEATPYWLTEVERVLEKPGSEWGRGLQHQERLEAVESPDQLNLDEVLANIKGLKEQVTERLSKVSDSQLTEENPHRNFAKFGNKPVSFIIEHFIDEHTVKHLGQIERNLSKLSGTTK